MHRFLGKFIGTILGLGAAGLGGGIVGLVLGHLHDLSGERQNGYVNHNGADNFFPDFHIDREQQLPFAMSVIVLGAKLAKADGVINEAEIIAFRQAFRPSQHHMGEIGNLFNQARASAEGYEPHAARLAQLLSMQHDVLEDVLSKLFYIARSDSKHLAPEEIHFLRRISIIFGFSESDFIRAAAKAGIHLKAIPPEPKEKTAYDLLGVPASATDAVIKKTYRTLIRKYHPDKLQASGLSAEKVEAASEKVKQINAAYADICKQRKIK